MVDILHMVGVEGRSAEDVYGALTTVDGLAGWWTETTSGRAEVGGTLEFRFNGGGFDMTVLEQVPYEHVVWRVVDGPAEWIGTTIDWRLRDGADQTTVLFQHRGWREPVEFMHHCSTKWATFLMSLKAMLEAGSGAPFPHDVHIAFGE